MAISGLKGLSGQGANKPSKPLNPKAKNTKTAFDKNGLPVPTPKVNKNFFGVLDTIPVNTADMSQVREMRLAKTEVCLLKGITSVLRVSTLVGSSWETAKADIETIQLRWQLHSSKTRLKQARGQAIHRLDRIIEMLEGMAETGANDVVRTQAMKYLMDANAQRMLLDNLTPKTLLQLDEEDMAEGEGGPAATSIEARVHSHHSNQQLANALAAFLSTKLPAPAKDDDIVEVEYVEVQRQPPAA